MVYRGQNKGEGVARFPIQVGPAPDPIRAYDGGTAMSVSKLRHGYCVANTDNPPVFVIGSSAYTPESTASRPSPAAGFCLETRKKSQREKGTIRDNEAGK